MLGPDHFDALYSAGNLSKILMRTKRYAEKPSERRRRKEKVMAFTCMLRRRYAE